MTSMKMSLPKIFTRKSFLLLVLSLLAISLFLPKIVEARYFYDPGGGGSIPAINEYKEALEEEGVNLQQFSIYNMEYLARGGVKLAVDVPILEGQTGTGGGAFGAAFSLIAGLYKNPPASSIEYLADIRQNLGLARPAYAQGVGWTALRPVLEVWKIFRDLAYLFFVIIFVIVGFMIMFRKRIDPQTVIGIQNALPRIVVALLLVTFSYAIAGLMFDLMEFGMALISALIRGRLVQTIPGEVEPTNWNIFKLVTDSIGGIVNLFDLNIPEEGLLSIINLAQRIFEALRLSGALSTLIIAIAIVFTAFKLFFALLGKYVAFVLATIFGPLLLVFSAVPGRGNIVWFWLRTLLTSLLSFPAVYAMLAIAAFITDAPGWAAVHPMEDIQAPRMLYYALGDPRFIKNLLGLGILLTAPKVPELIDQLFGVTPTPGLGEAAQTLRGVIARFPVIGGFVGATT